MMLFITSQTASASSWHHVCPLYTTLHSSGGIIMNCIYSVAFTAQHIYTQEEEWKKQRAAMMSPWRQEKGGGGLGSLFHFGANILCVAAMASLYSIAHLLSQQLGKNHRLSCQPMPTKTALANHPQVQHTVCISG